MSLLQPINEDWKLVQSKIVDISRKIDAGLTPIIPGILQEMLISAEDHRYFHHSGYDVKAILRAAYKTASGYPQGASTIAQQLARVLTGRYEKTINRKIREIQLAVKITKTFPKTHIPAIYLIVAYYGWRMNGLEQAYRRLNISGMSLSVQEAAGLIARLKYPEPHRIPVKRQNQIAHRTKYIIKLHRSHWLDN